MGASVWKRYRAGTGSPPYRFLLGSPGGQSNCKHGEDAAVRCSGQWENQV